MNPRDDAPKNPLDEINPEDDVELQKIEALEARAVEQNPGQLRVPARHRDQPVPERVVAPTPKPVVTPTPTPSTTPVTPKPQPVAPAPVKTAPVITEPSKPQPKPEPKATPLTTSAQMDNELAKAPPLNVAQTIRQFFGKQRSSHPSVIIVGIVVLVIIAVGGYFAWQYFSA